MTPITDEALAAIKAGLEGVTPGPWAYECHGDGTSGVGYLLDENDIPQTGKQETGEMLVAEPVAVEVANELDADHIARMDPDTVLSMLARIEAAEAA